MAQSDALFDKARMLRSLADDIEVCCDGAHSASAGSTWHCDNATEVRGAIGGYRGAAQRAAAGIRDEAADVTRQAHAAKDREDAARPAPTGGHPAPE